MQVVIENAEDFKFGLFNWLVPSLFLLICFFLEQDQYPVFASNDNFNELTVFCIVLKHLQKSVVHSQIENINWELLESC